MKLINEDLAPVPQEKRTWNSLHFFSLWVGMAVCIPSYMIASSLISSGMSLWQAVGCVFLGNSIVLIPMILNGVVGAKYGIPFPVFTRASFGVLGSNVPALLRAIVACGWFGIQTWIGGLGIYSVIKLFWPGFASLPNILPDFLGVETAPFISFMIFWTINVWYVIRGIDAIKFLETWCAPVLIVSGLSLLVWAFAAVSRVDGTSWLHAARVLFAVPSKFETNGQFWAAFIPGLTAMVGYWATLSLNIPDFTRYAKNQKSQIWGQALGLPTTMTLFALIGVVATMASQRVYGEAMWNPVQLIERFDSPIILLISTFMIGIATLTTNVAANIVGPANDFANMFPALINYRRGGMMTAVIGILMMPWKLIADPEGYVFTWLIGYSSLLGPIGGILLVDFFVIRKQKLILNDLYSTNGEYTYSSGMNPVAMLALVIGVLPNIPGFLNRIGVLESVSPFWLSIYNYAWFVGLPLAGLVYFFLTNGLSHRNVTGEACASSR